MSKHTKLDDGPRFLLDTLAKIGYAMVFLCATFVLMWSFDYISGKNPYYLMGIGYLIFYVLFAPALVLLILGRRVSRAMRFVGLAWLPIVLIAIITLGYGFLKDALGAHCTGFFSAPTSCASNQFLIVLVLLFNPYTLLAWMILTILGLIKGWWGYFADRSIARSRR